jgi:BirA family biotin operon repressor/biotin-[acetyl-CoA-carboxylase] ligase
VEPGLPGFTIEILPQTDSTNSELMRRARLGQTEPVLLVAEHQTAGRGRLGRTWHDGGAGETPAALMFSLGLPLHPANWSGLSLAVGLSVAQALHDDLQLKWPNDIWYQQRKLAGILIETSPLTVSPAGRYVVVGVGVNMVAPDVPGLSTAAAALDELWPGMDAAQALARVLPPLVAQVKTFEARGFGIFKKAFEQRDGLRGLQVSLSDGQSGTAMGVDENGALLVHTSVGLQKISSSEVSVRPA